MFESIKVKPQKDESSDKFSWNLYRVIKKAERELKKYPSLQYRFFWNDVSCSDGSIKIFDTKKSLMRSHVYVMKVYPMKQGMAGSRLSDIMSLSPKAVIRFSAYGVSRYEHMHDITEWFWNEYVKYGRCIFDREHTDLWQGEETRFITINKSSRKCNWCEQHQKRQVEKETHIERKEIWTA